MDESKLEKIKAYLHNYEDLGECVLEKIAFKNYGVAIELEFYNIWNGKGQMKFKKTNRLILKFNLIQEFKFKGALNRFMVAEPEQINWGINEIAAIRITDNPEILKPYSGFSIPFHHAEIVWEQDRRIDIVFGDLDIIDTVDFE